MRNVKKHFTAEAADFDLIIRRAIPQYQLMLEAVAERVALNVAKDAPRILDLGAGTGELSKIMLEKFPNAQITVMDFVPQMLELAGRKLAPMVKDKSQLKFIEADFSKLPLEQTYDAVVASFTLHHLRTDADKIKNYRGVYKILKKGGVFCAADIILGTDKKLTALYINKWVEFLRTQNWTDEENECRLKMYKAEDFPASLVNHLRWLSEIGFTKVDCLTKYYNFAVFGGTKN